MHKNILISIGISILFLGLCVTPSVAIFNVKKSFEPILSGNTLYVGGTGEGNYSKIQDAINDASNGDTVFVFNGTYYENIVIDKSISLIGEDKDTTIIDGDHNGDVLKVTADWVNISGFTIQSGGGNGLYIQSNFNTIYNNNVILNSDKGIYLRWCLENSINNNIIQNNDGGIILDDQCGNNNIICNNISKNNIGISLSMSYDNKIEYNNIEENECGISALAFGYCNNLIKRNNFIKNKRHAKSRSLSVRDEWDSNYWDNWIGVKIKLPFFQRFPKIIFGFFQINFDRKPAKEPYNI
jgi:parallel beta-helix repeat protein